MAVKGKGKQVAADSPGEPVSGGKRLKGSGDTGSSSSSAKRRRRSGVLQFVDDAAGLDDEYEEENEGESEEDLDDGFFTEEHVENVSHKRTERSHPLPFLVKEEELSGDELEEFVRNRYSNGVKFAADRNHQENDDDMFPMDGALKEPTIWKLKCMVGRERQMVFCFMQKFVDLQKIGTKVPIITAFALDHVRGFIFIEAEKPCDVIEACKGFCNVYASRITSVPAAEVPSLLSTRTKPFEIARGTWVRMKNGNYKGDLAQVVSADDGRKRVMIKLIPRVDLHAISKKFGGAISLKEAGIPTPRLISSQELEFFRPHIEMKRDRQTGEVFEVLDGLMFKDGFIYKRVALSSLIYWGIQPTETELLKFSSSPSNKSSADDLDWVSGIYGSKKRNLPENREPKASSSKMKSSKASNLKASTSTEIFDDNEKFNLHDLVLFGRKDFGVVLAFEKYGLKILKGGPEGSAVTVRKQEIKKSCVDKMFTAVDHQKKIISINDTVRVLEGPSQGKEGVVKHLYMGILFIHNESESENFGFFCAQCGSCENIKRRKEMGNSTAENLEVSPIPMFSQPSYEQNEQRSTERPYRSTREQLFSIGQMLRIRKGPLKGYLCRVVRIYRNDVTVKLDSLLKIVTVQAEFLSVPSNRGDITSGAPTGNLGSQVTSLFGSEADKTSWGNGLPSLGSDSWQPFSSSTLPVHNTDGETEDPWGKKTVSSTEDDSDPWSKTTLPSADGDSDPWGKKIGSFADKDSDPWGKKKATSSAAEVWNNTQKEGSSDNAWGKQAELGGSDAAGSSWDRITVNKEGEKSDNWGNACRVEDVGTGDNTDPWGSKVKIADTDENDNWAKASMPSDNKLEDDNQGWQPCAKTNEGQGKDNGGCWDTGVTGRGDDAWVKSDTLPAVEDGVWGGGANCTTTSNQPWSSSGGSKSFGKNRSSTSNSSGDNNPSVGEHNDPWASKVTSTEDEHNDPWASKVASTADEHNDPWASKMSSTAGKEHQNDTWETKMASTADAEDNGVSWNSKAQDPSCSDGGEERKNDPWANKNGSNKGTEQETDPWASKLSSIVGADDTNDSWNIKAKDTPSDSGGKWGDGADEKTHAWRGSGNNKKSDGWGAGSSNASWDKPSFSLGDQEPAWGKPRFSDDNNGNSRGGFGRGNRGRGQHFGDSGSSWNGGNFNDESGGGRSEDQWNRMDFDGSSGRGRWRFGRGGCNQGNNYGSDGGGSWGSGRGNGGRGGRNQGNNFGSDGGGNWGSGSGNSGGGAESGGW